MSRTVQKTRWALGGAALLLSTLTAFAGAPAGDPDSIDSKLWQPLMQRLDREGYRRVKNSNKQAVSAYLWDNRHRLTTTNFPEERQIDVLVCLLYGKDHRGLEEFASNARFKSFCVDMLKPRYNPTPRPQD